MSAIAYIDESGDHGLENININFPVLTVAAFVIREEHVPAFDAAFSAIKREYFGSESVILHSRDVRKQVGAFNVLQDEERREQFYDALNNLLTTTTSCITSITIRKDTLISQYKSPDNPYCLALEFLLERLVHIGKRYSVLGQEPLSIRLVAESRGKKVEDPQLLQAFDDCQLHGTRYESAESVRLYCPEMKVMEKKQNCCGLQMADMVAYPIARHALGTVDERTWNVIRPKLYGGSLGNIDSYGAKIFP